jgi:succinoglycan biosynthesis protein ExoM
MEASEKAVMNCTVPRIDVCICTFRRPLLLHRLLREVCDLQTEGRLTYSLIVGDNDVHASAREVVSEFVSGARTEVTYCVEPVQNIARVRNRVLDLAKGEFVALIDDDEYPAKDWLLVLLAACQERKADGVLGPVLPEFSNDTPDWFRRAGLYDFRKRHSTGEKLRWQECRTGNALLRREILKELPGPFREEFGTGGEDQDFFRRAIERGKVFTWCDEALVYEAIQPSRWSRRVVLGRALLRGKDTFKHRRHRWLNLAKALVAVPLYCMALPVVFIAGQHHFMKLITKLASHTGLLLASVGLNPMNQRHM